MAIRPRALVLFSGGKDSFLAASRLIQAGYHTTLISFNNGAVSNERILVDSASRLENRYGTDRIVYAGCYDTCGTMHALKTWQYETPWSERAAEYPNLNDVQIQCLTCQTAMWAAAIAYGAARHIPAIACGYRKSDIFCTGWAEYFDAMSRLASKYRIELLRPVWDDSAWTCTPDCSGRDLEMEDHGFSPVAYEPACKLGRPAKPMTPDEKADMRRYLDHVLIPVAKDRIQELMPAFLTMKLTPESTRPVRCRLPDGSRGLW